MLKRVLADLAEQNYKDFTVIVSQNGVFEGALPEGSLRIRGIKGSVVTHAGPFKGLADHYEWLFNQVQTPFFAVAHDDERYSPDWLSSLMKPMQEDPTITFSVGPFILRRIWGSSERHQELPATRFCGGTLDFIGYVREAIIKGRTVGANGFVVRTSRARERPFSGESLEYDLAWFVELIKDHKAYFHNEPLNTYTLHGNNTLGSREHLTQGLLKENGWSVWNRVVSGLPPGCVPDEELKSFYDRKAVAEEKHWWKGCKYCLSRNWPDLSWKYLQRHIEVTESRIWRLFPEELLQAGVTIVGWVVGPVGRILAQATFYLRFLLLPSADSPIFRSRGSQK